MSELAYKGFTSKLRCRDFQFEVGKEYEHIGVVRACVSGFHACGYPLDVFNYYPPATSRYALVELGGDIQHHFSDSKRAAGKIQLKHEMDVFEIVEDTFLYNLNAIGNGDQCREVNESTSGNHISTVTCTASSSRATASRAVSAATGFKSSSGTIGHYSTSVVTGDLSAVTAVGNQSASVATGIESASDVAGSCAVSVTTGSHSGSCSRGIGSVSVSTGEWASSRAVSVDSVAVATGIYGMAKAVAGGAIVLAHRDPDTKELLAIRASRVGENGIKPDTWYSLDRDGNFVECDNV